MCAMVSLTAKTREMSKTATGVLNMSFHVDVDCVCHGLRGVMVGGTVPMNLMRRDALVVAESSPALMALVYPKCMHVMADLIVQTAPMSGTVCVMQTSTDVGVAPVWQG